MTSLQSDTESNVSGFIRYNDKDYKHLYKSIIENMQVINQDILEIEKNMKNIIQQSGPLESQLTALLSFLPKSHLVMPMDME